MTAKRLLLGTRKGLLILEQRGKSWELVHEAHRAIPVSFSTVDKRNNTMWACLDSGHWGVKLHRSRDNGINWEEVPAPRFPEGAELKPGTPAVVSYLWYLVPGHEQTPERLYIGTEPGGLFQSDDGGDHFELVDSLWNHPSRMDNWFGGGRDHPGISSFEIDPRNPNHMIAGISVGGVYETVDGGETWEGLNRGLNAFYLPDPNAEYGHDPHYLLMSPSNPDVMWQQNHCGVFRSEDRGRNWHDISNRESSSGPVFFGFALAVDPKNDKTAWVVPAVSDEYRVAVDHALCVCRTEDGGKTWTELRNGLPQKSTYDLVYRHALDLNDDALVFGTTTGNLYFSSDRGDSWETISTTLPPIFSVKFA